MILLIFSRELHKTIYCKTRTVLAGNSISCYACVSLRSGTCFKGKEGKGVQYLWAKDICKVTVFCLGYFKALACTHFFSRHIFHSFWIVYHLQRKKYKKSKQIRFYRMCSNAFQSKTTQNTIFARDKQFLR